MSDTPHPDPLDEQASDLFDAGADAPGDEPELGARLDEFRALRDALADVPPAPDAQRTGAIAAALALFDELAGNELVGNEPAGDEPAGDEPGVVTPLRPAAPPASAARAGAPGRHRRRLALLGAAASIVVALGVVALVTRDRGLSEVDSASSGVVDGGGFSQAKAADDAPAAAESAAGGSAAAGDSDTTAAAAAAPVAAASSTSVRAATSVAAATTAAASGGLTSPAAAEPTSTTDGRDVTTTTDAGTATTTSPPTTTSTNVDAGALPYLGELTTVDDVAEALRTLPPVDSTDAGALIRAQLASGACDLRPYGTPIAVLRWNGRDSVLLRSADAPIVQLIPLDGCNPIVQLDAPS